MTQRTSNKSNIITRKTTSFLIAYLNPVPKKSISYLKSQVSQMINDNIFYDPRDIHSKHGYRCSIFSWRSALPVANCHINFNTFTFLYMINIFFFYFMKFFSFVIFSVILMIYIVEWIIVCFLKLVTCMI